MLRKFPLPSVTQGRDWCFYLCPRKTPQKIHNITKKLRDGNFMANFLHQMPIAMWHKLCKFLRRSKMRFTEMLRNSSFAKRFIIAWKSFALNYGLHNRPRLDMTIIFCSRLALCCFRIANCCFLADKLWMATGNSFWIIFVNEFSSQLVAIATHASRRDFSEWIADSRFSWFRNA